MDFIQQEINKHKTKLTQLTNNLINTQLINEEIYINNEIKKESECLVSLLNVKQNDLLNKMNPNLNQFAFQQNPLMNPLPLNINPVPFNQQQIIQNKNIGEGKIINIFFHDRVSGEGYNVQCTSNDTFSEIIEKYRKKANDFNENYFLFNGRLMDPSSTLTVENLGILNFNSITVVKKNIAI